MYACIDNDSGSVLDAYYLMPPGGRINQTWCEAVTAAGAVTVTASQYHSRLGLEVPPWNISASWQAPLARFDNVVQVSSPSICARFACVLLLGLLSCSHCPGELPNACFSKRAPSHLSHTCSGCVVTLPDGLTRGLVGCHVRCLRHCWPRRAAEAQRQPPQCAVLRGLHRGVLLLHAQHGHWCVH